MSASPPFASWIFLATHYGLIATFKLRTAQLTSSHRALNRCSAMSRQDWALCFRNNLVNCSSVHMCGQPPSRLRSRHDQIGVPLVSGFQNLLCWNPQLDEVVRLAPQICVLQNKL